MWTRECKVGLRCSAGVFTLFLNRTHSSLNFPLATCGPEKRQQLPLNEAKKRAEDNLHKPWRSHRGRGIVDYLPKHPHMLRNFGKCSMLLIRDVTTQLNCLSGTIMLWADSLWSDKTKARTSITFGLLCITSHALPRPLPPHLLSPECTGNGAMLPCRLGLQPLHL